MAVTLVGWVDGNVGWAWPAGTQAGDLALVTGVAGAGLMTGLTGFTKLPDHEGVLSGSTTCAAYKLLTSDDVLAPPPQPVLSNGFALMTVWRGPITVAEGSAGPSSTTNNSQIPGFTKNANSQAILVFQADRDPAAASGVFYPTGFTAIGGSTGTYFMTKLSYLDSGSYSGGNIDAPLPAIQYAGIGIAYDLIGEAPPAPTITADFASPMGFFEAQAKQTAQLESADFVGPFGSFDTLLVSLSGDPAQESVRHSAARVVLEGTAASFDDVVPTYQALQAGFVGPFGSFTAQLNLIPEIDASFVSPFGHFDAELIEGIILTADFVAPFGQFDAEIDVEVPLDIGASFVGPFGSFDAELQHYSVNADFVGPFGSFNSAILSSDGLFGDFVGPFGSFDAELKSNEEITADFVGPFGGFDAQLGEDMRTVALDFVGPFGSFDAELFTPNVVIADFVSPFGSFATELEATAEITADFVSPFGHFDALITRGPRLDAFFRSPFGHFDAELEKEQTVRTLQLMIIQP